MVKNKSEIRVSAIVSTYNSEEFIEGRIKDLLGQTIFESLEVIVVISGSEQKESEILTPYKEKYANIKIISTNERETIYQAWNRGIHEARGKYITNANSDDRLRSDALQILSEELDKNPEIALVYGDQYITSVPNTTFREVKSRKKFGWSGFSRIRLLEASLTSAQPMWRASLHFKDNIWFNENLKVAGDYEFALRVAEKYEFKRIKKVIGVYYKSPLNENMEFLNTDKTFTETYNVRDLYTDKYLISIDKTTLLRQFIYYKYWSLRNPLLYYFWKLLFKVINEDKRLPTRTFTIWYSTKIFEYLAYEKLNHRLINKYQNNNSRLLQQRFKILKSKPQQGNNFISVILPTFDRPQFLKEALFSLANQTYKNFEVLIVDNGEIPSKTIVEQFAKEIDIKYFVTGKLQSVGAAKNIALKNVRGEWIAYLDDDDWFHPNHLEVLSASMSNSGFLFCYTDAVVELQETIEDHYRTVKKSVEYSVDFNKRLLAIKDYIFTPCVMHHRKCINAVGYFDEYLKTDEDHDYWIRMSKFYDFLHIKKITCSVRRTKSNSSLTKDWELMYNNEKYLFHKHSELYRYNPLVKLGQLYYIYLRKYRAIRKDYGSINNYY